MVTKSRFDQVVAPVAKPARAPRAAKAKTVVEPITPIEPITANVAQPSAETLFVRMRAAADDYFDAMAMPSWTRRVVSVVLGLVAYGGVFYGCMQVVEVMCLAAITYSGVGFISFMIAFLGVMASFIAATTVGVKVYELAMAFDYINVKSRVTGWINFTESCCSGHSPQWRSKNKDGEVSHA